jgi:hypothetical protein
MAVNSWLHLTREDPRHRLPDDLRQRDPLAARDCGWVDQMLPFIASHAGADDWIIDPFCGFGSTLLAAQASGVRAAGVELDPQRVALTRERLARLGIASDDYPVLTGSLSRADTLADLRRQPSATGEKRCFTLCLTNIPYFGCNAGDTATPAPDQRYADTCYEPYLQGLREVFVGVHELLEAGGWCIVMAQNLRLNGHFVPLAWDVARLLGERFILHEERVLIYDRPADPAPASTPTNRAHEYALICRKQPAGLDTSQGRELLARLQQAGFEYIVYGSFQRWLRGEPGVQPNDIDLICPPDDDEISRLLRWLDADGFRLESWNAPIHPPVSVPALAHRHYLRARRIDRHGHRLQLDISIPESRAAFDKLRKETPTAP